ncbi:DUF1654 domain-containing protein [Pseudomonas sp. R1-18]|uniref:DUF1654 domain-containing protein n=1 Tax=Pseudomonas sp. R1-18 TaxID=1632772 RepID=UPI003DAA0694
MAKHKMSASQQRQEITGIERLGLRVSAMINHPVAQTQRWVMIHRLDTDGDQEWEAVMELLSDTDELDMVFNDDGTVLLRWERASDQDQIVNHEEVDAISTAPPF